MAYSNSNRNRTDVLKRMFVVRPAGAKFNNSDATDKQVYLNGVAVSTALFSVYNSSGLFLGRYVGTDGKCTLAENAIAGLGTAGGVSTVGLNVGPGAYFYDLTTGKVLGWYDTVDHSAVVGTSSLGKPATLNAATALILANLQAPSPPSESSDKWTVPTNGATLYDASLNAWTIEAGTNHILANNVWVNGQTGDQIMIVSHVVYARSNNHYFSWNGSVWTDTGTLDPRLPTPSTQCTVIVPTNASAVVDSAQRTWTFGPAAGPGFVIYVDGAPFNGGSGWGKTIKIGPSGDAYHENPSGLGWIYWTGTGWSAPGNDPCTGTPPPPPPTGSNVTTGSISASSNLLTVVDDSRFTDALISQGLCWVIVQTGKEPGAGALGTLGIGGQYPFSIYTSTGAMNAAFGGKIERTLVGLTTDGNVYQKFASNGVWTLFADSFGGQYYGKKIQPLSIMARVRSVNRATKTLTLEDRNGANVNAAFTVSGATVYLDGGPIINNAILTASNGANSDDPAPGYSLSPTSGVENEPFNEAHITRTRIILETLFPGDTSIAVASVIGGDSKRYVELTCNSINSFTLYSPDGVPSITQEWVGCKGCRTSKFTYRGNWSLTGYRMGITYSGYRGRYWGELPEAPTNALQGGCSANIWISSSGCVSLDHSAVNVQVHPTGGYFNTECRSFRVKASNQDPPAAYIWDAQYQQSLNCHMIECESDSNYMHGAFEQFVCTGGNMIRPKVRNGVISFNNVGSGYLFGENPSNPSAGGGELRFNANCAAGTNALAGAQYLGTWNDATNQPVQCPNISINDAAGSNNASVGGTYPSGFKGKIAGTVIVVEGPLVTGSGKNDTTPGIKVAGPCVDIRIERVKYFGTNWIPGSRWGGGAVGIQSDAPRLYVDGNEIRGIASNSATSWNIYSGNGGIQGPNGNITDSGSFFW